ncbi:hypothetical protein ATN88_04950 [Enterovibrio coralii]|uniref:HTH luxR-type domain-containing protein n=2 Tax=Enterovibrio coralii TaxID=294935 RepID=A0A135IC79_9GAMM|nr:hypothetical protein ATN88_04950 [Enterovibrio coralii]
MHELIASIYESASNRDWMPALEKLQGELGANRCILGSFNPKELTPNSLHITNLPPVMASFQDTYVHDPIYKVAARVPPREVMILNSVQKEAPFKGSWFFNEYHVRGDVGHIMGSNFILSEEEYAFVALNRSSKQAGFDDEEYKVLSALISHFVTAFDIYEKNCQHAQNKVIFEAICSAYHCAICVVDESGRVQFSNELAEELFRKYRGLSIYQGRLTSCYSLINSQLAQGCQNIAAMGMASPQMTIPIMASEKEPAMQVRLSPIVTDENYHAKQNVRVLVSVKIAESKPITYMSQAYGFTKSEARVAELLVQGNSLQEISDTLFRSRETIKTHLKNLMSKTKTHSQTKLISVLLQHSF